MEQRERRNGDFYVTRWEFEQIIEPIRHDVAEIKTDVKKLLGGHSEGIGAAAVRRGLVAVLVAAVSAGWWLPDLVHAIR